MPSTILLPAPSYLGCCHAITRWMSAPCSCASATAQCSAASDLSEPSTPTTRTCRCASSAPWFPLFLTASGVFAFVVMVRFLPKGYSSVGLSGPSSVEQANEDGHPADVASLADSHQCQPPGWGRLTRVLQGPHASAGPDVALATSVKFSELGGVMVVPLA